MPQFQKDPSNPKADFFNTAIGGAPKSPGNGVLITKEEAYKRAKEKRKAVLMGLSSKLAKSAKPKQEYR